MTFRSQRLMVIAKIESIFEDLADALLDEQPQLCVELKIRNSASVQAGDTKLLSTKKVRFPGKNEDEAWRFAVIIRILELIHDATVKDEVLSKRDIYYQEPALFRIQSIVDRYVDDIALTFDVKRSDLNVTAAAKGLYAGALVICRRDGSTLRSHTDRDGILVPPLRDVLSVDMTAVLWILVVEKEASFRSLTASCYWDEIARDGIIVTGKGYPDISTRQWLHFLSHPSTGNGFKSCSVYCLVDFDPDGVTIMSTYQRGSKHLAHEEPGSTVPHMRWLGLRKTDIGYNENHSSKDGLLVLSTHDRAKARNLLAGTFAENNLPDHDWRCEVQTMLMLNVKAEIQVLGGEIQRLLGKVISQ